MAETSREPFGGFIAANCDLDLPMGERLASSSASAKRARPFMASLVEIRRASPLSLNHLAGAIQAASNQGLVKTWLRTNRTMNAVGERRSVLA
jgi:hypothetical protein